MCPPGPDTHINTDARAPSDPTPPLLPLLLQLSARVTWPGRNVAVQRERDCSITGDRRQQQQQSGVVQVRGEGIKKGGGGRRRRVRSSESECGTPGAKRRIYSQSNILSPTPDPDGARGYFFFNSKTDLTTRRDCTLSSPRG